MDEVQDLKGGSEMSPTPPFVSATPSKSPLGLIIKIVLGVLAVVIVGTGIALATRLWDPLWNPFRPEPEEVLGEMATKMKELKTVHSEMKIDVVTREDAKEVFKASLTLIGNSDNTDLENLKSAGDLEIVFSSEGMKFSFGGEIKTIGQAQFIKLATIPAFSFLQPFLMMLGIDLNKMKNQWIKYDQESYMKSMLGEMDTPEMEQQLQKQKEKQQELVKEVKEVLKDKKLYLIKKEFPDKKIQDVKTYHYLVALNKEEAKEVILELLEILIQEQFGGGLPGTIEPPMEEISEGLDKFFEKVGEIAGELWIGKKDNYLYKVKFEKEIDSNEFVGETKEEIRIFTIKFDMDFSNFNLPVVKIEAPENFLELKDILTPMPFLQPGLPVEMPEEYPLPKTFPYEQPTMQKDTFYLFQASLLRVLLGLRVI